MKFFKSLIACAAGTILAFGAVATTTDLFKKSSRGVVKAEAAETQYPLVYTFKSASDLDGFTIINANNDSFKWAFTTTAPVSGTAVYCSARNDMNDWLITPAMTMKAGVTYKLSVTMHGDNTVDRIQARLYVGNAPTVAGMTTNLANAINKKIAPASPEEVGGEFTPTADGDYYLGIQCTNEEDESSLYVTRIEIADAANQVVTPAAPTNFEATTSGDDLTTVTLSANAPLKSVKGDDLTSLAKVEFYCGDRTVGAVTNPTPGQLCTVTDNAAATGKQIYTCKAFTDTDSSEAVSTEVFVGRREETTYPLTYTFQSADDLSNFTIINANNDSYTWGYVTNAPTSGKAARCPAARDMDDWLITPPMDMKAGTEYKISVTMHGENARDPINARIYIGAEPTVAGMTTKLDESINKAIAPASPAVLGNTFTPTADGIYYLGIHCTTEEDESQLYVPKIEISLAAEEAMVPTAPTDFTAIAATDGSNTVTLTAKAPLKSVAGADLTSLSKVEFYCGDRTVGTVTNPTPGQVCTVTDNAAAIGSQTYTCIAYTETESSESAAAEVFVGTQQPSDTNYPVVYTFSSSADLDGFTIINANNDSYTWGFISNAPVSGPAVRCIANRDMNDWLITPGMEMKAGVTYKAYVTLHGANTVDRIQARIYMGAEPTVAGMTTKLADVINKKIAPAAPEIYGGEFTPTADGKFYLGIHCTNEEDESPLYVTRIEIQDMSNAVVIPVAPSEFTATPDAEGANKVTLSAKAPTVSQSGETLAALTKVEFYNGDRVVGTVDNPTPGQVCTVADENAPSGKTSYSCKAFTSTGESEAVTADVFVGIETTDYPLLFTFQDASDLDEFTIINANSDSFTWRYVTNAPTSGKAAACPANRDMNDWLITPGFIMKAGTKYQVSVTMHGANTVDRIQARIYMGAEPTVTGMTTMLAEAINKKIAPASPEIYGGEFAPAADGKFYLGIHCTNEEDESYLYIPRIEIKEMPAEVIIPAVPTDFTAIADEYGENKVTLSAKAPTQTAAGETLSELTKVEFYCGDRVIGAVNNPAPGQECTVVDENAPNGDVSYSCKAFTLTGESEAATAEAFVGRADDAKPVASYTFGQASDLDGFTIINANNDSYTWRFVTTAPVSGKAAACPANRDMNDWLITPGIELKAGLTYKVSVKMHGDNARDRIIARIWMGTAPTVAGMTTKLADAVNKKIAPEEPQIFGDYFTPAADGKYYLGIHCTSEEDESQLYVTLIEVQAPVSKSIPAVPTDFKAIPNPDGLNSVTLKATAPTLTEFGEELKSLTKLEFYCGDRTVGAVNNPAPGQECTFVDENATPGNNTYTCIAYNTSGQSEPVTADVFVGVAIPGETSGLSIKEEGNTGKLRLSWTPISKDEKGNDMNTANVKYNVSVISGGQVVKTYNGLTEASVETDPIVEGGGAFASFKVAGVSTAGEGKSVASESIPVGLPLKGMSESFSNKTLNTPILCEILEADNNDSSWKIVNDTEHLFVSQDHDNGYLIGIGWERNNLLQTSFLKLDLSGMTEPQLSFYTYTYVTNGVPSENLITIKGRECGGEFETLLEKSSKEIGEAAGWHKVNIDLSKFAGKTIELRLLAKIVSIRYNVFDNFRVGEAVHNDIVMNHIVAPEEINPGDEYEVTVTIVNEGLEKVSGHKVALYANNDKVDEISCDDIEASGWQTFTLHRESHVFDERPVIYYAEVAYDKDSNNDNNRSKRVATTLLVSDFPTVTDLNGTVENKDVKLTWSAPNINRGFGETKTEDFESAPSFATEFKWWTFVDCDGQIVGGLQNIDVPNIPCSVGPATFFVWDNETLSNSASKAASGTHFLASMYNDDDSQVDDWAISPILSGARQTITFKARSFYEIYPESMEVLYSTGSLDPKDFISVKALRNLSVDWTEYSAELPEGALRFALRNIGAGGFILMIDDVCYQQGANYGDYHVTGYDVFRDRVKLNSDMISETSYTDTPEDFGEYEYAVLTHYAEGKSGTSNVYTISVSGVDTNVATTATIVTGKSRILVKTEENTMLTIHNLNGILIHEGDVNGDFSIDVTPGIYVVTLNGISTKVLVK